MLIENLNKSRGLVAVFLFLVSFTAFAPSLRNDFVWDDIPLIIHHYNSLKLSNINSKIILRDITDIKELKYFRPIFRVSLIIDHEIWGSPPFGFHLSNTIFHSTSTVLLYFLVLLILREFRIKRKEPIAFISSVLFALHPMHVESVSWVSARADLLCSIFLFSAFILHILSTRTLAFLIFSSLCFFLSLLSKEVAVVFPILIVGFDLICYRRIDSKGLLKYVVYGALTLLYLHLRGRGFVNVPMLSGVRVEQSASGIYQAWEIISTLLSSYLFYIIKLVFPFQFNAFIASASKELYYVIASVFVILLLCLVGFISIRKRECLDAYAIFWVFVTIGPPSLLAVLAMGAAPLAERFTYIPSAGFCMLIG
ncbi:MAG TPA: hypothetical protein VHT73_07945, partial [Thermodesulfobacteriota bacterium]|nr:hypothetical protein [Thermodesulfobacteriota bacterium]